MMNRAIRPTGEESPFGEEEFLVTKTDFKGRITYANETFLRVSGFSAEEAIGAPHSIVRHPAMPRCIFKLVWDTIRSGDEIFAYILNMAKNGDHYWVFAHMTPTVGESRQITGFHSSRRKPYPGQVARIEELYDRLAAEEARHEDVKDAMQRAATILAGACRERQMNYDEFVLTL